MTFRQAIDRFVQDMRSQGRISSNGTEHAYRKTLVLHAEDVSNRDPDYTNRDDVKCTLRRWSHPNTQANRRAILVSFYDWLVEEGHRPYNPARQTRRPRKRQSQVYRLTLEETRKFLNAAATPRERRAVFIGVCAGARNAEIRGLQGRHFDRPGWLWISKEIGKGGKERWLPVIADLAPVVAEIQEHVAPDEYILPREVPYNLEPDRPPRVIHDEPCSPQTLWRIVRRVGKRAGIAAHLHPHLMRHAYGDHAARYAGMRNAQFLLGHADIGTTETYTGTPTLDELAAALKGFSFGSDTNLRSSSAGVPPLSLSGSLPHENPGIAPSSGLEPNPLVPVLRDLFGNRGLRDVAKGMGEVPS